MAEQDGNDDPPRERPSFTKFWKRIKQVHSTDNLRFVSSGPQGERNQTATSLSDKDDGETTTGGGGGGGGGGGSSSSSSSIIRTAAAAAKAQARRAQVRKAQIQHRQRKANYTKQLEMDIAKLRDGIARVGGETAALRSENDTMKQRLAIAGVPLPPPPPPVTATTTTANTTAAPAASSWSTSSSASTTQYTVSLDMSETNSPTYQVYRTSDTPPSGGSIPGTDFPRGSSSDAAGAALAVVEGLPGESGGGGNGGLGLTEAQTDYAINFILALEHVCWDHFHPSYFAPHVHGADGTAEENGHMLMASAIALQSAPVSVFEHMGEVKGQQGQQQQKHQQSQPSSTPPHAAHRHRLSQLSNTCDGPPSSSFHLPRQTPPPPPPPPPPSIHTKPVRSTTATSSWKAHPAIAIATPGTGDGTGAGAGLTLENLRRLAAALNPPDVELTPVQAWFEIARERGPGVALDGRLMDALRRELALHVRCVQFGAVMQRSAFDDVVGRVVGGGGGVGRC